MTGAEQQQQPRQIEEDKVGRKAANRSAKEGQGREGASAGGGREGRGVGGGGEGG